MNGVDIKGKFIVLGLFFLVFSACAVEKGKVLSDKLPDNLKVVSVYGERPFLKGKVFFAGWESDAPQTLFLTDGNTTFLLAYVLPRELIYEVWKGKADVIQKLEYFTQDEDGYVKIDERTTALNLVLISPPYFWLFTPRAIVFAAGKIVEHEKFEELVYEIEKTEPGELIAGKHPEIFSLAQEIAEDVRSSITPADFLSPRISEKDSSCGDGRIADLQDAPGTKIKLVVKHMVFYGGGVFNGIDPTKISDIRKYFLLNSQRAKIDLSLDNIITLNFINPSVETEVDLEDYERHGIRLEKGFELSTSIFTDPIKRIGLVANFGRIVKYVIEVAVPNIAACIPDGDVWGYVVVTSQNLFTSGDINDITSVFKSSWDEIMRAVVSAFVDQNSWIYRILNKVGFASCAYSGNFIISQIAATLRNFPIVKLYDAFTKYIPFGYELFTKPKTGVYGTADGAPLTGEQVIVSVEPATKVTSPGVLKIETVGPECKGNCSIRLVCDLFGTHDVPMYLACGLNTINFEVPYGFYGQDCKLMLAVRHTVKEGGFLGFGGTNYSQEIITSQYTIDIVNCPSCAYNPSAEPPPEEGGGGGCSSSSPYNVYTIFAIGFILFLRALRGKAIDQN